MASPAIATSHDFRDPGFNAPLDVQPYITSCAPALAAKGMFFSCITRLAREKSGLEVGNEHYPAFKNYSMTEWLILLPECAQLAYPHLPLRAALFEIGGHVYRTFAESTIGRVVMSMAGRDTADAVRLVPRAFESVGTPAKVRLVEQERTRAVVEFRDTWDYPDCYMAGILAGGARSYGQTPRVRVRVHSRCDVDVEVTW